jgi:hypothetical protein
MNSNLLHILALPKPQGKSCRDEVLKSKIRIAEEGELMESTIQIYCFLVFFCWIFALQASFPFMQRKK